MECVDKTFVREDSLQFWGIDRMGESVVFRVVDILCTHSVFTTKHRLP